jgi:hypothetical protein
MAGLQWHGIHDFLENNKLMALIIIDIPLCSQSTMKSQTYAFP